MIFGVNQDRVNMIAKLYGSFTQSKKLRVSMFDR